MMSGMISPSSGQSVSELLFGKTRQGVLGLLFGNPDRDFYQQEIAQAAGTRLSAVQRELSSLAAAGLIKATKRGNRVYYHANRQAPIFPELAGMVRKTVGVAGVLRGVLGPLQDRIVVAFVFGSVATGTATAKSDVDLLVVGDVGLRDLAPLLPAAREALGRELNPVTVSPREWAERLGTGDHFMASVASGEKLFVTGDEDELRRIAGSRPAETA